jgi:hypothetical protein
LNFGSRSSNLYHRNPEKTKITSGTYPWNPSGQEEEDLSRSLVLVAKQFLIFWNNKKCKNSGELTSPGPQNLIAADR